MKTLKKMKDLYKEAIKQEQENLNTYRCDVNVELKEGKSFGKGFYVAMIGAAAILILVLLMAVPNNEIRELNRADRLIAKMDISIQSKTYSFDTGKNSIKKFNQKISKHSSDSYREKALIRKFNSMSVKYEQKN